ncbi:unnamed protein product [Macrosiphum euphorbiae]|uniref:Sugar transporter n=1 Tax=Macrosiphum euphorbiae TaxID=13131 RepID=A0AAV0XQF1_9HEMI|nr:unnamed protein product [Macrosiphum euphorbiae]
MSNKNEINMDNTPKTYGPKATVAHVVSWYESILFIFHPTGSFLSGFLQERYGRKQCMILANVPSIFGWILLYYTHSTVSLYSSTVLMGLGIGFSEASISSYVGEITEPRLRGSMASLANVALLSTLCPITCICLVILIPESPVWLVSKAKNEKAENSLCWLRGWVEPEIVKTELLELIRYNEVPGTHRRTADVNPVYLGDRRYTSKIVTEVGISNNQSLLLVVFAVVQTIGSSIVVLTVHYLGKIFLTNLTFFINTLLMFLFGIYIVAIKNGYIYSITWIPITYILCGINFFGASVIILPWIARGIATGSSAGLSYLLIFILTKSYIEIEILLTLEYTMVLFGCLGIFGSLYLYFYLPETENKTLLEIEEFLT